MDDSSIFSIFVNMRDKHWKMKEGFLVGGGIIVAGILLQLALGPINWSVFAAPVNYIVLAQVLALIGIIYVFRQKLYVFEWMMHASAAVPSLCYAAGLTIIMGLTVQTAQGGIPWLSQMLSFWPFVLIWSWMMLISGLATLNHLLRWQWREIPFILNHLGVFIAIVSATLGSADVQMLRMNVFEGNEQSLALDDNGKVHQLNFALRLNEFTMESYQNGMPKRFASDISVSSTEGGNVSGTVEVNKPLKFNGWKIYQYSYDVKSGPDSQYSVFMLVRDPWLPLVYLGIFMMLAGALCLVVLKYVPKRKWVLLVALLLTGFFTYLTVSRMGPTAKEQPPALQSPWFIPHLIVYMAGYAMLATATLIAVYMLIKPGKAERTGMNLLDNLVYVGLAFLTIGMLFGALWAKEAWGHYWSWDPKETWAAITWISYLVYVHFRRGRPDDRRTACWILIFAFICLQMCWWGINYLPSAQGNSVHTYNSK